MAKDNVLRCLIHCTINGDVGWHIIDAIEENHYYAIVLRWTAKAGEQTEFPSKRVGIKKDCFDVISNPRSPYELRCKFSVNFDDIPFTDEDRDAEELWRIGDNLFYPRPDDEDL
jgi:hypothetical protein